MGKKMSRFRDEPDDFPIIDKVIEVPEVPDRMIISEPKYIVPKGKSLNCRSGIIGSGCTVTPEMVIGGIETLEHLVYMGALIKE